MATTEQDITPEAPAETETKTATRTYVVLAKDDDTWHEIGASVASTDQQAIANLVAPEASGTWVAIPERSFNPRTRILEPQPPKPVWS